MINLTTRLTPSFWMDQVSNILNITDESKAKITHVPGAVLYQFVDNRVSNEDFVYEIGDEKIDDKCENYVVRS